MSYFTSEQRRNIDRLVSAIKRKEQEMYGLPAKLKGRSPKDIARIRKYVEVDIAYLQGYLHQWKEHMSAPVCTYGTSNTPATSPTVGKPKRSA